MPKRSSLGSPDMPSAMVPDGEAGTSDDDTDDDDMEGEVAPAGKPEDEELDAPASAGGNLNRVRVLKEEEAAPLGRAPLAVGGSDGDEAEAERNRDIKERANQENEESCEKMHHNRQIGE